MKGIMMPKAIVLMTMIVFCAINVKASEGLLRDLIAISDVTNIPYESILNENANANEIWMLIKITPSPLSGSGTAAITEPNSGKISLAMMRFDTATNTMKSYDANGNEIDTSRVVSAVKYEGIWSPIWVLAKNDTVIEKTNKYSWLVVQAPTTTAPMPSEAFPPFAKGGMVLCRFLPQKQGLDRFSSTYYIPEELENKCVSAMEYLQSHKKYVRTNESSAQRVADFRALLQEDNFFLSIYALRKLMAMNQVDSKQLFSLIDDSKGLYRSCCVYALLKYTNQTTDNNTTLRALGEYVEQTFDVERLEGVAQGIFAYLAFSAQNTATRHGNDVLVILREHILRNRIDIGNSTKLKEILDLTKLPDPEDDEYEVDGRRVESSEPNNDLLYAVRAVHDGSKLPILQILKDNGDETWMLIEIKPDQFSGGAKIVNPSHKGQASPSTGTMVTTTSGSINIITQYGLQNKIQQHRYVWEKEPNYHKRTIDVDDIYPIFDKGGIVFSRYNISEKNEAMFFPTFLLTREWQSSIKDSHAFVQEKYELFEKGSTDELLKISKSSNPVVATYAVRMLLKRTTQTKDDIEQIINAAPDSALSHIVYIYLCDKNVAIKARDVFLKQIAATKDAKDLSKLRAFALGAYSAILLKKDTAVHARCMDIITNIREQIAKEDISTNGINLLPEVLELAQPLEIEEGDNIDGNAEEEGEKD